MFEALSVFILFIFYHFDVLTDLKIIRRLCCHHLGTPWTAVVNVNYCIGGATHWHISSVICNVVTYREIMVEFKNPFLRIAFLLLGLIQILPSIWFLYCIFALSCCRSKSVARLMKATVKVKMFEALFEGLGQMCLQTFMVMEQEQFKLHPPVGNLSFHECIIYIPNNASTNNSTSSNNISTTLDALYRFPGAIVDAAAHNDVVTQMVDNWFYISIAASLISISSSIIKGVSARMDKGSIWTFGYGLLTFLAIGSRGYLKSTLGTYWFIYWLTPIITCSIASMIYAWAAHKPKLSFRMSVKRSLAGTLDFLSADGLPTSASYFICSAVFNCIFWPNIHLQIGLGLNAVVMIVNLIAAFFFVKQPIFHGLFEKKKKDCKTEHAEMQDNRDSVEYKEIAQE